MQYIKLYYQCHREVRTLSIQVMDYVNALNDFNAEQEIIKQARIIDAQ